MARSLRDDVAAVNEIHSQIGSRTRQRQALEHALHDLAPRSFDAQELLRAARRYRPRLGLATVYRALAAWRQRGGVREVADMPGQYVVCERPSRHHHHVVCVSCGRTRETSVCAERAAARALRRAYGFLMRRHRVEYLGLCAECGVRR